MVAKPQEPNRIGVGLYSIPEAARLVRVSTQLIRRWLDPEDSLFPLLFDPEERTVSFLELMELHFIKMFRDAGVSMQTIRKTARTAARKFNASYPFAVHRFDTDGRTIFATMLDAEKDQTIVEDLRREQYCFDTIVRPFFKKLEYGESNAIRFWPLDTTGRVVLDPERCFGKPIDSPTRVPTRALFRAVEAGDDPSTVAAWFGVPITAVDAAVTFETSLAARDTSSTTASPPNWRRCYAPSVRMQSHCARDCPAT